MEVKRTGIKVIGGRVAEGAEACASCLWVTPRTSRQFIAGPHGKKNNSSHMHVFKLWEGAEVTGESTRTHTARRCKLKTQKGPLAEESNLGVSLLVQFL